MLCSKHNYTYDFGIGSCPYCEQASRASAARELAEEAARQRAEQLDLDRASLEQSQRHHEDLQAAVERQAEMEEQRASRLEEMEDQRRRDAEEREEQRRQNHEETLERARLAKIRHEVEVLCRSSERKLAAGRVLEAAEDAERALDQDPDDDEALSCAYFAAKNRDPRHASVTRYLERWAASFIAKRRVDSATFESLLCEAAQHGRDGLIKALVDAYHGAPASLRSALAKIARPELLGSWLNTRLKQSLLGRVSYSADLFLDAIAALPDGQARIERLAADLVELVGFNAPVAEWLQANGFGQAAATYVDNSAARNPPNKQQGFDRTFAEWLIANNYFDTARRYLTSCCDHCSPVARAFGVYPLAIEASRRMKASTGEWITRLENDLSTLPLDEVARHAGLAPSLSSETRDDVVQAMLRHVKHVIDGPRSYRLAAGVDKPTRGAEAVFSVRKVNYITRPLLHAQPLVVGLIAGLVFWLVPGGNFIGGVVWGFLMAAGTWSFQTMYRFGTAEISSSLTGKFAYDYCQAIAKLGAQEREIKGLLSKAPNVSPRATYITAMSAILLFTGLVCFTNYLDVKKVGAAKASEAKAEAEARTASGEWVQDWNINFNGNRLVARLYEQPGGTLSIKGFDISWRRVVAEDPRWTVALGRCSIDKTVVSCDASYTVIGRPEYQGIPGRFTLDLARHVGLISVPIKGDSPFTMDIHDTPSSLTGAPKSLLRFARENEPPTVVPVAAVAPSGPTESPAHQSVPEAQVVTRPAVDANMRELREPNTGQSSLGEPLTSNGSLARVAAVASASTSSAAEDRQSHCKVWKPSLLPEDSVSWSGPCLDGYANGRGVARWSNGGTETLTYNGEFRLGVLQGRGVMTAAGGDRYEGEYKDGKRDGQGVYSAASGQRYSGEFRDNKRHGRGISTDANGVSSQVEFRDGQQVK